MIVISTRARVGIVFLASSLLAAGCADSSVPEEGGKEEPRNHETRQLRVRAIQLDEMRFPDPIVGEKLRRFDAFANRVAQSDWHRRPYKTFDRHAARGVYHAEWATFGIDGRNPLNYHGPREVHCISLAANFDADDSDPERWRDIVGVTVYAKWKPAGTGWGATLKYRTFNGHPYPRTRQPDEDFHFSFQYYRENPDDELPPQSRIEFRRDGRAGYSHSYRYKSEQDQLATRYLFAVAATTDKTSVLERRGRIPDAEVKRILTSPETMRDFGIAAFTALASQIEKDIPTGKTSKPPEYDRMPEYGEDLDALRSDRKLTDQEERQVLADARREVQGRIETLRQHYKEMYAALEKTFALKESLEAAVAK